MKKIFVIILVIVSLSPVTCSFAFLDYLFSGSSSRDAIDNSAVGDLRSWWTGNPAYTFNPYYSGSGMPQGQQQPGQAPPQPQQPIINYYPPSQGAASYPYAQQQAPAQQVPQQQMQYGYGQPQQTYQPQGMQPPAQYQAAPQAYQYQQGNPQQ